ncbi:MAG TPA: histidine phosphatase family protein [Mycobacteriales bacterium]|nr:histidine phosphatase family protein [Mycobacteriales bacterium]
MGELVLVRHGQTEWSRTHRHTGRTDIPLTSYGERQAASLAPGLAGRALVAAFCSPLVRARRTAELAGVEAVVDDDLAEWHYGDYEGSTTAEIRAQRAGWWIWTDGAPGGETAQDVGARCTATLQRVAPLLASGNVALFGHGHALRALAAVWVGLPATQGGAFTLDAGSISILGTYREHPVVMSWNDVHAHPAADA